MELLKLKDKNSLIIKIGYSSYWSKGQNSEFIVYQPNSSELKTKVKRKSIKKKEYQYYWNHLNNCI